jgi:transcription elongation factor Elf1
MTYSSTISPHRQHCPTCDRTVAVHVSVTRRHARARCCCDRCGNTLDWLDPTQAAKLGIRFQRWRWRW